MLGRVVVDQREIKSALLLGAIKPSTSTDRVLK
jgi:hypothetical protein